MFSDYFFPELGGIQDSIATTGRSLAKRGHQVDFYVPRYSRRDYRRIGSEGGERDLGSNVRVVRRRSLPFPSSTRQSRAALTSPVAWVTLRWRARPDVIHAHSFFGVGLEALLNGALLGIPVIGTNHTTVAGFGPYLPISVEPAAAYVLWFYNRCDYVTAPSRSVFAELGSSKLQPPHGIVSNPIDTSLFTSASESTRAALKTQWGLSYPTVTYAGRLGPEKNIEVLFRAVSAVKASHPTLSLAIAGHGSHEATLRALAATLGIASHVRFFGTLDQADLARLFQASDVFAMMSTSETQSMALLQAMACGVPVVAADCRALPEFVNSTNGVLADPHDSASLARILADLLALPDRRRDLGEGGRRSAEKYCIETVTDEWESIYRIVVEQRLAR